MVKKDNKKNTYIYIFLSILLALFILFLTVRYFKVVKKVTSALPRLTLSLYDDLDAFMQYDY